MDKQTIFIFIFAFLGLGLTMIPSNLIQRYLGSIPYIISIGLLFLLSIFKIDIPTLKKSFPKYDYTNFYLPLILMGFMITAIIQVARNLYAESGYFYVNQILFFIPLIAFAMFPKNGASKQDQSIPLQTFGNQSTRSSPQNLFDTTSLDGGIIKNIASTSKWVWLIIAALAIGTQMILLHIIDLTRNFFETDDGEKKIKELEAKLGINN